MVVRPGDAADARNWLGAGVEIVELPIDDSWLRDSGPIFVTSPDGRRAGVHFRFNSWGERFLPYDDDARIGERLLAHLGEERVAVPMVLEGGSISVDGQGTLITTEQCLLNPNRNPTMTREEIEETLRRALGVNTIIWLPYGLRDDSMTDGHVDGVCAFIRPGTVLLQVTHDERDPNWARLQANRRRLAAARDATGRPLEILELPYIASFEVAGKRVGGCYLNFYVANGGVVTPLYDLPTDGAVLDVVRAAFPDREVVGVPARTIAFGGGGIHCITQQVPALVAGT
jgi:agmatine deiminase